MVSLSFYLLPVSEVEDGDGLWRRGACGVARALQVQAPPDEEGGHGFGLACCCGASHTLGTLGVRRVVSLVGIWWCNGGGAGVVVAVALLSGYFGREHLCEFCDAEVLPDSLELGVAAFKDEVAKRIGCCRFATARAPSRSYFAADRVPVWVSFVLLVHLSPGLERAVPCCGEVVESGCEVRVQAGEEEEGFG